MHTENSTLFFFPKKGLRTKTNKHKHPTSNNIFVLMNLPPKKYKNHLSKILYKYKVGASWEDKIKLQGKKFFAHL